MDPSPRPEPSPVAFNVLHDGAAGDGNAPDTVAPQRATDASGDAGGGAFVLPAGAYLTAAVSLRTDASLSANARPTASGNVDPSHCAVLHGRWHGVDQETHVPVIGGSRLEHIAVTGRGVIRGRDGARHRYVGAHLVAVTAIATGCEGAS